MVKVLLARLSLIYNALLLGAVVLNLDWARSRAAGGNFQTFPVTLRLLYAFQFLLTIFLIWYITRASTFWSKILTSVFVISTLFQLLSRSPNERWNALPAAIIAFTFYSRTRSK